MTHSLSQLSERLHISVSTLTNWSSVLTSMMPTSTANIMLYKLVFDNIDSDVRSDVQKQLVHYVQLSAVKDRVNFSHLPEAYPTPKHLNQISLVDVLPSSNDHQELRNFTTLVSCIMTKHLVFLSSNSVCAHIPHKYQSNKIWICVHSILCNCTRTCTCIIMSNICVYTMYCIEL